MSDMNDWHKGLRDRIAIQEEVDRINAKPVVSEFELCVMKDVTDWIYTQENTFDTNKQAICAYWSNKLR